MANPFYIFARGFSFFEVGETTAEAAALVGRKGNDRLAVGFDFLEEREHRHGHGPTPIRIADKEGII